MSSYGTINVSSNIYVPHNPPLSSTTTSDTQRLLPTNSRTHTQPQTSQPSSPLLHLRFLAHFSQSIATSYTDCILLFGYLITGLLDSAATTVWGSFVSMQTGNTIYFAQGLVNSLNPNIDANSKNARITDDNKTGDDSLRWIKAGVSIACFCAGSLAFSRFHRWAGRSTRSSSSSGDETEMKPVRWAMVLSTLTQALCVASAALIVTFTSESKSSQPQRHEKLYSNSSPLSLSYLNSGSMSWPVFLSIGLVSFQSGGQAVLSRVLNFTGLTGVVLTSVYCDLFADAGLLSGSITGNAGRNRRIAAVVLLLIGAVGGDFWVGGKGGGGIVGVLWGVVVLRLVVVVVWVRWKARKEAETEIVGVTP